MWVESNRLLGSIAGNENQSGQRLRELIRAYDIERGRISHHLHDGALQLLSAASMRLGLMRLGENLPPGDQSSHECQELVNKCLREIQYLSRRLHPPLLEELGLPFALRHLKEAFPEQYQISLELFFSLPAKRFSSDLELTLFHLCDEALEIVRILSRPTHAVLRLETDERAIRLTLSDNGQGVSQLFRPPYEDAAVQAMLVRLEARSAVMAGKVLINSNDDYNNSRLLVIVPLGE